jgi:release factor glutamine methyltransferase
VRPGERVLDVGCGAGLAAIAAARLGARVVALDVNPTAVRLARRNAQFNDVSIEVLQGDLLTGVRAGSFGTILFNPPYLPTDAHERLPGPIDRAFDGGASGRGPTERLLSQLGPPNSARLRLVASTLQDVGALEAMFSAHGWRFERVRTKPLSFETLFVYGLSPRKD